MFAEDEIPEPVIRKRLKREKRKSEAKNGGENKPAEEEEVEEEVEEEREKEGREEEGERGEKGDISAVTSLQGESPAELSDSGDEEGDSDSSTTDIEGDIFFNDHHSEQVRMMS